jgi:peptidoglycan/xylan/chitin deacetylase (PgdA/CDA1 family)
LTFDDGPSPRNTPRLLDVLARHGAHATFFMIARRIRRHGGLVERIRAGGHEIGIHGDFHVPAWSLPRFLLVQELEKAVRIAHDVTGCRPRHYRAPFGFLFPRQAAWVHEHGLSPVLGSIYPRDHAVRRPAVIAERVLSRLESGSIVILHDSSALGDHDRGPTIDAVATILEQSVRRSLGAVSVAELEDFASLLPGGRPNVSRFVPARP